MDGADSCYNNTFWDQHHNNRNIILAVKGCTGALSLVAAIVSLILFFMFKPCYKKAHLNEIEMSTARLILYNAVAGIARSVVVILQSTEVNYDEADHTQVVLCKVIGFLDQWSIWGVLLTTQMIMLHLFIQLAFANGVAISKKISIEIFYIVFPVLFPLSFSWVPFILHEGYNMSGAWCWICDIEYQVIFWFAPLVFCQIINLIFLIIVYPVLFFKRIIGHENDRSDLIKQHVPLLLSLFLAVVVNIVAICNRSFSIDEISGSHHIKLSVWILHAIASSCWGIESAIVIILHLLASDHIKRFVPRPDYKQLQG